jgi:hypothetical protein
MEVKIGVQHNAREIVLESPLAADDVVEAVQAAIKDGGVLSLDDERGRRVVIPAEKIAYVEIGVTATRPVGFGG